MVGLPSEDKKTEPGPFHLVVGGGRRAGIGRYRYSIGGEKFGSGAQAGHGSGLKLRLHEGMGWREGIHSRKGGGVLRDGLKTGYL